MGAARRRWPWTRRRSAAPESAEGCHDEPARRMAAEERRTLQRSDHAGRALGPRGVSERRRLVDRLAVRQRSQIPDWRIHDEHALQARARWLQMEAVAMPRVVTLLPLALMLTVGASTVA